MTAYWADTRHSKLVLLDEEGEDLFSGVAETTFSERAPRISKTVSPTERAVKKADQKAAQVAAQYAREKEELAAFTSWVASTKLSTAELDALITLEQAAEWMHTTVQDADLLLANKRVPRTEIALALCFSIRDLLRFQWDNRFYVRNCNG